MKDLQFIEKKMIDEFLEEGIRLNSFLENIATAHILRFMRKRLYLSQAQLAKRAGVSRSTINRIEKKAINPSEKILKKVFNAMGCDFMMVPVCKYDPDAILRKKAEKIAEKRINYVHGTMSLENQGLSEKWKKEFKKNEIAKLLENPSALWDLETLI